VSKSAVSRQLVQASEAEVEALLNRRFDDLKLLVIYIDGLIFGDYTMIGAVGVDVEGNKHVLGIREGATENSTVIAELLEDIVSRGVDPKRKMLFVIDGSKALRRPSTRSSAAISRCKDAAPTSCATCSTIYPKKTGRKSKACSARLGSFRPKKAWHASRNWPHGWISGTLPRPAAWSKAWKSASPSTGSIFRPPCIAAWRQPTSSKATRRSANPDRRVTHWQNGNMVMRWMASAFLRTEKRFNKIMAIAICGLGSHPQSCAACFQEGRCVVTST